MAGRHTTNKLVVRTDIMKLAHDYTVHCAYCWEAWTQLDLELVVVARHSLARASLCLFVIAVDSSTLLGVFVCRTVECRVDRPDTRKPRTSHHTREEKVS